MSEKSSRGKVFRKHSLVAWAALAAPLAMILACSKIVGIEDTEVGGAASGGSTAAGTGGSGTSGGVTNRGGTASDGGAVVATGGRAQGGASTSGGSSTGGDGAAGADAGEGPGGAPKTTGGASTGGKANSGGVAGKAGTGGTAGKAGTGGTSGGAGGNPATGGTVATGGAGGSGGACTTGARCVSTGRETCTQGQWKSDPCPLNTPTCEGAGTCAVRGPTMVKVDTFYVDSTEVTTAQYQLFLTAKNGDTSGQPAVCSWNTSYYDTSIPMNPDNFPMANVDWCDATAYCAWANKHLCGKKGGGAITRADLFTPAVSQWYLACGGPGGGSHPNNNPMCNSNFGNGTAAAVGTFPGCQGYYPGLFDLEGNVAEWVDGCDGNTGANDKCFLMGGGYYDSKSYCTEVYEDNARSKVATSFGFRCCSG